MGATLREEIVDYIAGHHVATLATTGGGRPWASAVFYASRDLTLYFVSDPASRHCRNLHEQASAAAAIHENYEDWRQIRGVQLEGAVDVVPAPELPGALRAYTAKFPFVKDMLTPQGVFRIAGRTLTARLYRLSPRRILLLDNRRGFGHREELSVSQD